ncbi:MAG: response regulator [Rubrivivax sp.]|nr:response regulator [Rubrivivax sp.]
MFERTRVSTLAAVPAALLVLWLLWPYTAHALLVGWLGMKLAVAVVRVAMDRRARADAPERLVVWGARFEWALAVDGLLFGMIGWLLVPADPPVVGTVMVAALLGIAAVGTVVLVVAWRPCMAFVLPALVPATIVQLSLGTRVSTFLGLGMALFLGLLVAEVRKSAAHTQEMLKLRYHADRLAAEREAALEQALRSDAAKSQFLATMSHEMRTPLHGILGLAHEIRSPALDAAERDRHLHTLVRAGDHLLGIINDVLDYSRIGSGPLQLEEQPFELGALLAGALAMHEVVARERGLELRLVSSAATPLWLRGDPARLRQVLLNLLGNAIKFTERGSVTLIAHAWPTTRPGDRRVTLVLEVADTGPGVPEHERDRIFDAFHQIDGSYGRRQGGTGLGLTISREIALAMGGDLVCLPGQGSGAVFRFAAVLPAVDAPAPAEAAAPVAAVAPADAPIAGLRVLLAEDNEVNALVAQAILGRLGATVLHASDGEQAVALAREHACDAVLMDCQMPGIDGFEATARIRADERAPVPIVALTANALEGDRERCLAAGMDEHLGKPFREEQLAALLVRLAAPQRR